MEQLYRQALKLFAIFSTFAVLFSACTNAANKDKGIGKAEKIGDTRFPDSELYNFSSPTVIDLPQELDEISGIAFYPKDTSVFAIVDENAILYKISITNPKQVRKWEFGKAKDFEDIVLMDSTFYVLVSNGNILKLKFNTDNTIATEKYEFLTTSKAQNEFETLYYDSSSNALITMCKNCEEDGKSKVTSYLFNDTGKVFSPFRQIETQPIAEKLGENKFKLRPSAAAVNPVTKDLYVVSSIAKCIVVIDSMGSFKEAYPLNPKIYKQPEGLTFTPQGDLIISNEVFLEGYANLLILKNKKK